MQYITLSLLIVYAICSTFCGKCSWAFKNFELKYRKGLYSMPLFEQLGTVTMYFKESCPYCKNSKEILIDKLGLKVNLVDVEGEDR
jgi:hypothetical protein